MKTNEYLYGKDITVPKIPQEVIDSRIDCLKKHRAKLFMVPMLARDTNRYNKVIQAIDFWESINDR